MNQLERYVFNKMKEDYDKFNKDHIDKTLTYEENKTIINKKIISLLPFMKKIELLKDNHTHKSRVMTKREVWAQIRRCWI